MKKDIKYFIGSFCKFFAFAIVIYVLFIIACGLFVPGFLNKNLAYKKGSNGHLYSRVNEIEKYKNVDVLFLGSSHAYRGFDPRVFQENGLSAFNLGSSAQTPIQTEFLLNRYLDKLNPKMVVYEVYPATFCSDGVESALDIISNDKNDFQTLKMAVEVGNMKVLNTMIYGFFRDGFHLDDHYVEKAQKKKDTYVSGGYVERKMLFYHPKEKKAEETTWEIKSNQMVVFKRIITQLKAKNIPYILVQSPITTELYRSHANNDFFDNEMRKYGRYYNFNGKIELTDTLHFYDDNHLNQTGVKLFNQYMIKHILNKK